MDFPQQPQGVTPFPSAGQPSTPPPFPNVGNNPMPAPAATPAAGPMPGTTLPPLGTTPEPTTGVGMVPPAVQIPVQSHAAAGMSSSEEQVYTMPDKFLASTTPMPVRAKKSNKAVTIILVVVIVLMLLGAVGGVLYYFLVLANQTTTTTDAQNAVVVNNANANTNVNATLNQNANSNANNANANTNTNAVVNTNANDNTNTAADENTNASNSNATVNTNENVNAATNANANENTNTNATSNTNVNTNTNTSTAVVPPAGKDSDADTLTNDEEAIWSTKADLPDTDGDGYTDGAEIIAGYDPTNAVSAGRLADSALVSSFANGKYGYTMLYPKNWLAEGLTEGDSAEVVFTPNTLELAGQFVAVTVTTNPTGLTASEWYAETINQDEGDLETITSFSGLAGVWSTDGTTAYYADSDNIYAISYRYGNSDELYFPISFEMMVKSFSNE